MPWSTAKPTRQYSRYTYTSKVAWERSGQGGDEFHSILGISQDVPLFRHRSGTGIVHSQVGRGGLVVDLKLKEN
jgi:hypothetical protein